MGEEKGGEAWRDSSFPFSSSPKDFLFLPPSPVEFRSPAAMQHGLFSGGPEKKRGEEDTLRQIAVGGGDVLGRGETTFAFCRKKIFVSETFPRYFAFPSKIRKCEPNCRIIFEEVSPCPPIAALHARKL